MQSLCRLAFPIYGNFSLDAWTPLEYQAGLEMAAEPEILIVADDTPGRMTTVRALNVVGCNISVAHCSEKGMEWVWEKESDLRR